MGNAADTIWDHLRGWIAAVVLFCVGCAAFWYLTSAPYETYEPELPDGLAPIVILIVAIAFFTLLALRTAFMSDLVLIIDDEGFRDGVKPRLDIRWGDIERFSVAGDLAGRSLSVFEYGAGGGPGRHVTVDLGGAGISVRTFLDRAAEFAPGIEVTTPASRLADFSAA